MCPKRRWMIAGLVVAGSVAAAAGSRAQVGPPPLTSTVSCYCTANAGGTGASTQLPFKCTISPSGRSPSEDIHVDVVIRNVLGQPLPGVTVVVTAVGLSGVRFIWDDGLMPGGPGDPDEDPQTLVSAMDGSANFLYDEGGVEQNRSTTFPNLNYDVTAQMPPWGPVPLQPCSPALSVVSYDLDADGLVNLRDFGIFAAAFGVTEDPEADFNWSGGADAVNLVDFGMFAAHYGASINNQ